MISTKKKSNKSVKYYDFVLIFQEQNYASNFKTFLKVFNEYIKKNLNDCFVIDSDYSCEKHVSCRLFEKQHVQVYVFVKKYVFDIFWIDKLNVILKFIRNNFDYILISKYVCIDEKGANMFENVVK